MRNLIARLFGRGPDDALDDLRQRLAIHRADAAQREHAVIVRARQLETGHYLGDRAGGRLRLADVDVRVDKRLDRPGGEHDSE